MTVRLVSQSKALHCYLLLSLWILLVIAGVYNYFDWHKNDSEFLLPATTELFHNLGIAGVKTKRIFRICNFPEEIYQGEEGILDNKKWLLKGLIVLIRHGDRGPLQHVKSISSINCNTEETETLKSYKSYLYNLTVTGKLQWTGPGPFHSFPVIPHNPEQCHLGQLTMQGVSQHLNLGKMLLRSYRDIWPKLKTLRPDEVLVHSTRYRRTFQSALAFLYGFINGETLAKVNVYESQSMNFCFKDCECPITDHLKKLVQKSDSHQLKSHPAIETLAQTTGKLLFSNDAEHKSLLKDPYVIRDALLTFVCHRSGLPCDSPTDCIRKQQVAGIIAFTDWANYQKWKNLHWKKLCLLRSYGHMRHIVQQMLHMVGSNGPNLVLYSGHDYTLLQLTAALGLVNDPLLLRYASRLVFEVYQDNRETKSDEKGIYFRLLSNGRDVTRQIGFCRNVIGADRKNALCKIEDIDACVRKSQRSFEGDFFQFR
ncbi:2-phosphoxylose phosphatase 1 isoform X2 [Anthonomus grandis grandis]|uniref:2-phosphoxylose phosphatase 1 isoform X2 n=1 Tax=Anthonomus grandis grandis TaxID=2921223 RepID=UPI0021651DC4|nr:2-phosphoxylose phosphatase 1 isoform X2 [Anthonomus grandis grandis]